MVLGEKIIRYVIIQIRPFQLVNTLVLVVFSSIVHRQDSNFLLMTLIWLEYFFVTIFALLINDYLHRLEDQKMGRSRLFTKFPAYPGMNLVILVIPILIVISIALLSGFVTLLIILINIIVAFLYGIAKHRGNVTASLILRFLHGNLLYLGISSFYGLIQVDGMIMIFIGLFDLFVHLSGDLRDLQLDIRANRSTFPTSFGTKPTYLLMIVLNFGSVLFFWNFEIGQNEAFLALILLSLAGWLLFMYCRFSDANYWFHASFHGPKELIYLILGLTYDHEFAANFLIHIFAIVGTLFLWFVSYYSYLWADSRI